jgi:hypothetical protein
MMRFSQQCVAFVACNQIRAIHGRRAFVLVSSRAAVRPRDVRMCRKSAPILPNGHSRGRRASRGRARRSNDGVDRRGAWALCSGQRPPARSPFAIPHVFSGCGTMAPVGIASGTYSFHQCPGSGPAFMSLDALPCRPNVSLPLRDQTDIRVLQSPFTG